MPIYRSKPQAPIIHFLPQSVSILLYGLSHKAMSPTGPHVGINLQPNVLVKYQETIVFCVFKTHRNTPHIKERGSLIALLAYVYRAGNVKPTSSTPRSICAMSLWLIEVASPSSQIMVTPLQAVPLTVPRFVSLFCQQTRSPVFKALDRSPVIT
jgi:hypothetical protein